MGIEEIKLIQKSIAEKGLLWTAGATSMSKLPAETRKKYLGLVVPEDEAERIPAALVDEEARVAAEGKVFVSYPSWDWRNASGMDWTTPVKDQSGCGACVAFATVALIESSLEIFKRDPYLNPNLSEADLFFRGCGSCCARGWYFVPALSYAQHSGIPDEACYPYDLWNGQNRACPDRDKRIIKITGWRSIFSASQAKEWISIRGPIMSGMTVYDDFFNYQRGIYKSVYGGYVGDHAICIVGYDDPGGYWVCKNSWGPGWGEKGWFKIAYGDCGIGSKFAFYTAEFTNDDDIVMPMGGRVFARFKEKKTAFDDEVWLHVPQKKLIFNATDANIGKLFEVGTFNSGTRLVMALKTPEDTFYTDQSMNDDACDHVKKVPNGIYKWEMRWEDLRGLGEQDYNDVVMDIEVFSPYTEDILVPKDGRVFVRFKSKSSPSKNEFWLSYPEDRSIFDTDDTAVGKSFDLGLFKAGTKLTFSIRTSEGRVFYTDRVLNSDSLSHAKKLPTGYNRWELRFEDQHGLGDKDFNDLIVEVEVIPVSNEDVVLTKDSRVTARLVSKSTPLSNEFWLHSPGENRKIFDASNENLKQTFDVGEFPAGTRLTFALKTSEGKTYYTDSNLNADGRGHLFRINFGAYKCQLRWEDLYELADRDYNDLVVEIVTFPKY